MTWRGLNWDGDTWPPPVPTIAAPDQRPREPRALHWITIPEGKHRGIYLPPDGLPPKDKNRSFEIVVGASHATGLPVKVATEAEWSFVLGLVIVGLGERKFL